MSHTMPEALPDDGSNKLPSLWDLHNAAWATPRGFPRRYNNNYYLSWPGHRGAYDEWTPISNQTVTEYGYQRGIDPTDNSVSEDYAISGHGYNRARLFIKATGSAGQTIQVRARIWQNETADEAEESIVLATAIPADNKLHMEDSDDYLGPWFQLEAVAEGDYSLTAVTVTIHVWKE